MSGVARRKVIVMLGGSLIDSQVAWSDTSAPHVSQIFSTACTLLYHTTDQDFC